jgi:hypothetical protein
MKPNNQLWLKYLTLSGLRCTEAFNTEEELEHNVFNQRFKELRSFYSSFMAKKWFNERRDRPPSGKSS